MVRLDSNKFLIGLLAKENFVKEIGFDGHISVWAWDAFRGEPKREL